MERSMCRSAKALAIPGLHRSLLRSQILLAGQIESGQVTPFQAADYSRGLEPACPTRPILVCWGDSGQQICNPPYGVRIRYKSPVFQEIANWAGNNRPSRPDFRRRPDAAHVFRDFARSGASFSVLGTSFALSPCRPLTGRIRCMLHHTPPTWTN